MRDRRTDPEKLRDLLSARRISNKVLGERLGLSPSMIQYVLAGDRDFGDENAELVAKVLGCRIEDFTAPLRTHAG